MVMSNATVTVAYSVLLNMSEAAARVPSPRNLPHITEPPTASMNTTEANTAQAGNDILTAASAVEPTKLPMKMPSMMPAEVTASMPMTDGTA